MRKEAYILYIITAPMKSYTNYRPYFLLRYSSEACDSYKKMYVFRTDRKI